MKKLMKTVAASAAALVASSAFAILPSPTADFESLATGEKTVADLVSRDDEGETTGNKYWFAITNGSAVVGTDVIGTVTNYPSDGDHGYNYFALDTSSNVDILYRTINTAPATPYGSEASDFTGESIGNGIYLDTMVKFTPSDKVFEENDLENGDKLAISYVESDDGTTNIVVRAGYVNGSSITAANYYMNLPSGFVATNWHQLTVRTIANVGYDDAPVGFAIYLDGNPNPLTYDNPAAPGTQTYTDALTGVAGAYLYTENVHALLPSLIDAAGTGCSTLSAVGFKGTGCIDDVAFKSGKPDFVNEDITVSITWNEGVVSFSATDNNDFTTNVVTSGATSPFELKLDPTIGSLTVIATYDTDNHYEEGTWTDGDGEAVSGGIFTVSDGATLNIRAMLPKFEVNGVHYGSFKDALDNATGTVGSPATIRMMADYTGDIAFDPNVVNYIVLDLAGQTLTGDADAAIHAGCANLTITNSTVTIGHVVAPEEGLAVVLETDAVLAVYAGIFDGKIDDDSGETAVYTIYGGSFYDEDYVENPARDFYLKDHVAAGLTISDPVSGYFTVSENVEPPAPTTYALTLPTGVNATATVTAGGVEVANITAIEAGTEVVVTWTANADYKITYGATENITMSENKTAATPTVVAIDYATLTIDTVANCSIVVSNATEEVATGAKFDKDDNVQLTVYRTPAEGYELDGCAATENITMDQNQTVTAAVKQSGGSYPSYIPDDPAVKAKYDTWATYAGVTPAQAEDLEDAYMLNCLPAEVDAAKAAFKFTSISYDATKGEWATETTTSYKGREYNGEVVVKRYSDVTCTTESATGTFFRAVLQ